MSDRPEPSSREQDAPDTPGAAEPAPGPREMDEGTRRTVIYIVGFILVMFGFAWGSIPLYRLVCKSLDPGGGATASNQPDQYKGTEVDKSRTITVRFATNVTRQLPWTFEVPTKSVEIHPGEKKLVKFTSENLKQRAIKGKAVYDINPPEAGQYFKKIECFCFQEQTLEAGQKREMPLYFWLGPGLPEGIDKIDLSYTFFNAQSSRKRALQKKYERQRQQ